MRKLVLQIFLGLFVVMTSLAKDLYPIGKIYLKKYACELNISKNINKIKNSNHLSFLDDSEKMHLNQLKYLQQEICKKHKNLITKKYEFNN